MVCILELEWGDKMIYFDKNLENIAFKIVKVELIDLKRMTFAEKIQERFRPYLYWRIEDIAVTLNLYMNMNKARN